MSNQQCVPFEQSLSSMESQFVEIASRDQLVHWQEESQFAMQSWYKNEMLQKCSSVSIQNAIVNVAAVGLTLNPANGFAYLVPEYDKASKQQACQLRISFKGLMKVAVDSGAIKWARAEIVRASDTFDYRGPCEMPVHSMNPFSDRGLVVGVYCIAKTGDGDILTDVMSKAEIDHIKSKAKTQFVWNDWYEEMAKKAIIKRASKQWPAASSSNRLTETVKQIDDTEGNEREITGEVVKEQPSEPTPLTNTYPVERFNKMFPKFQAQVQKGKKPDAIIQDIKTRFALTEAQEQSIRGIQS